MLIDSAHTVTKIEAAYKNMGIGLVVNKQFPEVKPFRFWLDVWLFMQT